MATTTLELSHIDVEHMYISLHTYAWYAHQKSLQYPMNITACLAPVAVLAAFFRR